MSGMEFIFFIYVLAILVMFMLISPSVHKDELKELVESLDEGLTREFNRRDNEILELKERLEKLEKANNERGIK